MKYRRKKLLNKQFQLGTIFTILGSVLFVSLVLIAIMITNLELNKTRLEDVLQSQTDAVETLQEVNKSVEYFTTEKDWDSLNLASDQIGKDLAYNIERMDENSQTMAKINENTRFLVLIMIIFVAILTIFLFSFFLKRTHEIYGPIFIMQKNMSEILAGDEIKIRPLRKKDKFKEFHKIFISFAEQLQQLRKENTALKEEIKQLKAKNQ